MESDTPSVVSQKSQNPSAEEGQNKSGQPPEPAAPRVDNLSPLSETDIAADATATAEAALSKEDEEVVLVVEKSTEQGVEVEGEKAGLKMEQGKQKPEAEAEQRQPDGEGSTELPTTFGFSRNFESERDEAEDETVGSKQDEQAEDDVFVLRAKIEAEEAERKRLGSEHVNEEQKKNMLKLLHLRSEENKIKRTQSAATEHVSEEEKKNMMKLLHLRSEENKLKRTKSAATNSGSRMPEMAQNERQGDNTNASAGAPRGGGVGTEVGVEDQHNEEQSAIEGRPVAGAEGDVVGGCERREISVEEPRKDDASGVKVEDGEKADGEQSGGEAAAGRGDDAEAAAAPGEDAIGRGSAVQEQDEAGEHGESAAPGGGAPTGKIEEGSATAAPLDSAEPSPPVLLVAATVVRETAAEYESGDANGGEEEDASVKAAGDRNKDAEVEVKAVKSETANGIEDIGRSASTSMKTEVSYAEAVGLAAVTLHVRQGLRRFALESISRDLEEWERQRLDERRLQLLEKRRAKRGMNRTE